MCHCRDRLVIAAEFEEIPRQEWTYAIKVAFPSLCYDLLNNRWNNAAINKIKNNISAWSKEETYEALKLAYLHKRSKLKSFNTGLECRLGAEIENAINNVLEYRF